MLIPKKKKIKARRWRRMYSWTHPRFLLCMSTSNSSYYAENYAVRSRMFDNTRMHAQRAPIRIHEGSGVMRVVSASLEAINTRNSGFTCTFVEKRTAMRSCSDNCQIINSKELTHSQKPMLWRSAMFLWTGREKKKKKLLLRRCSTQISPVKTSWTLCIVWEFGLTDGRSHTQQHSFPLQ